MASDDKGGGSNRFRVEVAYAKPDVQVIVPVEVEEGSTLRDAIVKSGVLDKFPELGVENMDVGVFGKLSKLTNELKPRDRVEIYRPLIADPKEVRKRRAAEGKRMKKGGGADTDQSGEEPAKSQDVPESAD